MLTACVCVTANGGVGKASPEAPTPHHAISPSAEETPAQPSPYPDLTQLYSKITPVWLSWTHIDVSVKCCYLRLCR